jgi:hypothetical protein
MSDSNNQSIKPTRETYDPLQQTYDTLNRSLFEDGMTIRTGKGGRYRYYTCNNRVNEGATSCKGRSIPMPVLDGIVLE